MAKRGSSFRTKVFDTPSGTIYLNASLPEIIEKAEKYVRHIAPREAILLGFARYMERRTSETFERLAHGGRYRGVKWEKLRPMYTRSDGTEIPRWGGVKKVRGEGRVKPQKRPSGKRYQKSSKLLQDTGFLKEEAAGSIQIQHGSKTSTLRVGMTDVVPYAQYHQAPGEEVKDNEYQRPYLFLDEEDFQEFRKITIDRWKSLREASRKAS